MHLVVVHSWEKDASEVASTIAECMGCLAYEAQQKISGGGPAVITTYAEKVKAEALAARLSEAEVPAFVVDTDGARKERPCFFVRSFILEEQSLRLELTGGESRVVDYAGMELLLLATRSIGMASAGTQAIKSNSGFVKNLFTRGRSRSKKANKEAPVIASEREETLRLYVNGQSTIVFDRGILEYNGLGDALQLTRELNYYHLIKELRRLAVKAKYDDRLLKRAVVIRLLGPTLNPETDLDLAFEILSRSLLEQPASG